MRRERTEIWACMIKNAKDGIKKTPLMYACSLSWTQLKAHLEALNDLGFVEERGRLCYATEGGKGFVEAYEQLRKAME